MTNPKPIIGKLVFHGAVVIFISFFCGGMIAAAAMGAVDNLKEDWVLAHMEAIINGMMLFIVAGFIGKIVISERQANIVMYSLIVMAYANTVFGIGRGATGSLGYEFGGDLANNITTFAGMLGVPAAIIAFSLLMIAGWKTR